MVNWKMKNVFINAHVSVNELENLKSHVNYQIVFDKELCEPTTCEIDTNFAIVDADSTDNLNLFINKYKKFNTKLFAFTSNTSKANILKLYSLGFDNVSSKPENLEEYILNIINPENKDVCLDDAGKYKNSQKVIILSDSQISSSLLVDTLEPFKFVYTIRGLNLQFQNDIQKDKYDLIIIDCKEANEAVCEATEVILKSKLNKTSPIILISDSLDSTKWFDDYKQNPYQCIEKPYKPQILQSQVKNILKIKELQDKLKNENNLLDSMVTNSFNQLIITDSNFTILGGGNQHIKIDKNEYFFNVLSSQNIVFPEEAIRIFSRTSQKDIKFRISHLEKTYEVIISKVFKDTEFFEQYLIVIEDITEQILVEEQKETFIATLTHDLKSPLRAEQNILKQLLEERFGALTNEQKMILKEILNSKDYENKMIDNLLTRYNVTSNSFKLFIEENNFKETIEKSVKEVAYLFENKNQVLEINYSAKTNIFEYDKTEIKRVLLNLLQNATEYTSKNGHVCIDITETQTDIVTTVTDNGYGIKAEYLPHIFDKNVTLAKKYRKVGAGLGLYICKTIINLHNGTIKVKSELDKGTSFTFTLPKKQPK